MKQSVECRFGFVACLLLATAGGDATRKANAADVATPRDAVELQDQTMVQIKKLGGNIDRDPERPGRPIVGVEFNSDQFADANVNQLCARPIAGPESRWHACHRRRFGAAQGPAEPPVGEPLPHQSERRRNPIPAKVAPTRRFGPQPNRGGRQRIGLCQGIDATGSSRSGPYRSGRQRLG